jgi:hypothetical protein
VISRNEREVSKVPQADGISARPERAVTMPEVWAASFDAFEAIRITARDH